MNCMDPTVSLYGWFYPPSRALKMDCWWTLESSAQFFKRACPSRPVLGSGLPSNGSGCMIKRLWDRTSNIWSALNVHPCQLYLAHEHPLEVWNYKNKIKCQSSALRRRNLHAVVEKNGEEQQKSTPSRKPTWVIYRSTRMLTPKYNIDMHVCNTHLGIQLSLHFHKHGLKFSFWHI